MLYWSPVSIRKCDQLILSMRAFGDRAVRYRQRRWPVPAGHMVSLIRVKTECVWRPRRWWQRWTIWIEVVTGNRACILDSVNGSCLWWTRVVRPSGSTVYTFDITSGFLASSTWFGEWLKWAVEIDIVQATNVWFWRVNTCACEVNQCTLSDSVHPTGYAHRLRRTVWLIF